MNGVKAYTDTSVTTQSKGRLIVILYEGAIKFMKLAIREMEAGNHQAKGEYINKARNIFNELNAVLDIEGGGEISANLRKLYFFINNHLAQANIKRDEQMIRDAIKLAEELNEGFKAITG